MYKNGRRHQNAAEVIFLLDLFVAQVLSVLMYCSIHSLRQDLRASTSSKNLHFGSYAK